MPLAPTAHLLLTTAQLSQLLVSTRKHRKLTQAAVAIRVGLSQNRISYLEKHPEDISVKQLYGWCAALGLELHLGERAPPASNSSVEW